MPQLPAAPDFLGTENLLCAKLHTNRTSSVPCLNKADCYTLLGNGWCITFENRDSGELLHDALTKGGYTTGKKGTQHQL